MIELRDDLGMVGVIELSDDDVPSPGRWRDAVALIRKHGETMYVQEVAEPWGSTRRLRRVSWPKPCSAESSEPGPSKGIDRYQIGLSSVVTSLSASRITLQDRT
jgi:hypothetical protein